MSLDLDTRQRAILQEMGVRVWWPVAAPAEVAKEMVALDAAHTAFTAKKSVPSRSALESASESVVPVLPMPDSTGIAGQDWSALAQAIAACQACKLCSGRKAAVFATGEENHRADWMVLGEPPDEDEERVGKPFAAQAGQLLDNMLKALGVIRLGTRTDAGAVPPTRAAYVSNVVKCRPAVARNPQPQELQACENYLRREVALVQPKVILALGRFAAQSLLQGSLPEVANIPLGKLRGQIYRYQGIAVIVSYHPGYLLRSQQDKARAWADLCLALSAKGS
jgi:DNA polymerase